VTKKTGEKMSTLNIKNKCKRLRFRLGKKLIETLNPNGPWLQTHIANCPKCQKRLYRLGKVKLAFTLVKSQPHSLDLLMRANTQTINTLKHSLRTAPKAEILKTARPEPHWLFSRSKHLQSLLGTAACLAFILLLKVGLFNSVEDFKHKGDNVVRNYCAKHLDQETFDEIFTV
jgi:hypothetical protein